MDSIKTLLFTYGENGYYVSFSDEPLKSPVKIINSKPSIKIDDLTITSWFDTYELEKNSYNWTNVLKGVGMALVSHNQSVDSTVINQDGCFFTTSIIREKFMHLYRIEDGGFKIILQTSPGLQEVGGTP